jgi:hypothetical protein
MPSITIDVALYGNIAKYGGGSYVAQLKVELAPEAHVGDLLDKLGVGAAEKGYIFINAVLADMPGLDASRLEELHDNDHVGIFSITHMWPYQYRDGFPMTARLAEEVSRRGALHHSYVNVP